MLNLLKRPGIVSPVFNKIEFKFSMTGYTIGDLFYLEIYKADDTLLTTLVKNGDGLGTATFDISYALQTLFTEVQQLDPSLVYQKDESAMKGYKVKAGIQRMTNNVAIKTRYYVTDQLWALRAALPLDGSETIDDYLLKSSQPAKFLTLNSGQQPNGSNIYLPLIGLAHLDMTIKAQAGSTITETEISHRPGLYVFNAKPELLGLTGETEFQFWLYLTDPMQTYYATKDYTANCSVGMLGRSIATASAHSGTSQADANTKATQAAQALAGANLVCVTDPIYQPEPGDGDNGGGIS